MDTPRRLPGDDPALAEVLSLLRCAFAFMDGQIDPPSSIHRLTLETLRATARTAEVWSIGKPPEACVILTPRDDHLYIGKLAVASERRGKGHARHLIQIAQTRAAGLNLPLLRLETRVELTRNHSFFQHLGFRKTAETAHPGYDRPTSYTFEKPVS